jgi:hypothetical protein
LLPLTGAEAGFSAPAQGTANGRESYEASTILGAGQSLDFVSMASAILAASYLVVAKLLRAQYRVCGKAGSTLGIALLLFPVSDIRRRRFSTPAGIRIFLYFKFMVTAVLGIPAMFSKNFLLTVIPRLIPLSYKFTFQVMSMVYPPLHYRTC